MIAVDTNVLARYLINDDIEQAKAAARLLAGREGELVRGSASNYAESII